LIVYDLDSISSYFKKNKTEEKNIHAQKKKCKHKYPLDSYSMFLSGVK